jgi:glycosyltransferase involved in cell wall biosynthesis
MPKDTQFNLVYVMRDGMPAHSCGGPRRIIAELFDQFRTNDEVHSLYYLCAAIAEKYSISAGSSFHTNNSERWKRYVACKLNRTKIGLYIQLVRDQYRFTQQWKKLSLKPCILHSHDLIASGLLFPSVASPKITTHHGKGSLLSDCFLQEHPFIANTFVERTFRAYEKKGVCSSDIITFPSLAAKKLFENDYYGILANKRVEIIYNGIPLDLHRTRALHQRSPVSQRPFRLLNVSAMVQEKRFDLVIDVVKELYRRKHRVIVSHIGEGYLKSKYQKRVEEEGLSDAIIFLGKKENHEVIDALYTSDAFFMPSERVVFDLVTLEAMAAGLPCVVSKEGGNLELITDGLNGCLPPSGDVRAYANSIEHLMNEESLRQKIGINARKLVFDHYATEAMAESYLRLYQSINKNNKFVF